VALIRGLRAFHLQLSKGIRMAVTLKIERLGDRLALVRDHNGQKTE
jgi:hypothetical protein